jgi:hypothetical protein
MECAAILDVARLLNDSPTATLADSKALVVRIVEMLSRMSRSLENEHENENENVHEYEDKYEPAYPNRLLVDPVPGPLDARHDHLHDVGLLESRDGVAVSRVKNAASAGHVVDPSDGTLGRVLGVLR